MIFSEGGAARQAGMAMIIKAGGGKLSCRPRSPGCSRTGKGKPVGRRQLLMTKDPVTWILHINFT
jgi:hypothetical protein